MIYNLGFYYISENSGGFLALKLYHFFPKVKIIQKFQFTFNSQYHKKNVCKTRFSKKIKILKGLIWEEASGTLGHDRGGG